MSHPAPARAERLRRRAAAYLAGGLPEAAIASLEQALRHAPDDDHARLQLALLKLERGDSAAAHALALEACRQNRPDPRLACERLEALRAFAEHAAAAALAAEVDPARVPTQGELRRGCAALESMGLVELARAWADHAVARDPEDPRARVNRALCATATGHFDAAEADLEKAAAAERTVPMAHWLLARLRRQDATSNHVDRLQSLMRAPGLDPAARAFLGFALHKELDDLGRHAQAWTALDDGLAARRGAVRYDAREDETLVRSLMERVPADPAGAGTDAAAQAATPIFIVGMHRSGTTLLERILEAHPAIACGGESYRLTEQLRRAVQHRSTAVLDMRLLDGLERMDAAALGKRYLEAHGWLRGDCSHFTEKMPLNYLLLGIIRQALPHARILHVVRDPMDTCWSNLRELFAGNVAGYSYDQQQLADAYARYRRLMGHWHAAMPGWILDVSYEDMVRSPADLATRVFAHCGLEPVAGSERVPERAGPVRTASSIQVRQPIHARSIGQWRSYAGPLHPLRTALQQHGIAFSAH